MPTKIVVQRGLLARVPGLAGVWIEDAVVPIIHLIPKRPGMDAALVAEATRALEDLVAFPTATEVRIANGPIPTDGTGLVGVHRFAALSSSPTEDGLREGVMKLVPTIGRLVLECGLGTVTFLVADENNATSPAFLDEVRRAVHALGALGATYAVAPLAPDDTRDDLKKVHFFVAARDRKLQTLQAEEEDRYEKRLRTLVETNECETLSLIDDLAGAKIFTTLGVAQPPLGAFLPIYDRIFVMMSPGRDGTEDHYAKHYGLNETDFFAYVQANKIVPVFKFPLGVYPERVWRRFTEDLSLRFVSGRDLDYACARYAWSSAEWVRAIREERSYSLELAKQLQSLERSSKEARIFASIVQNLLRGAERFEGDFWRNGHLAMATYSPAMPLVEAIQHSVPFMSKSMAPLEVESAAMHLSMGLALGAATYEGVVQNEELLRAVAERFGDTSDVTSISEGTQLQQILAALKLTYSGDIPPDEYLGILDEANTRRLRELVQSLTEGSSADGSGIAVRDRIQAYNAGVERITKKALSSAEVSLWAGVAAAAFGASWLTTLGVAVGSKVASDSADSIDSTKTGDALDWLRGKLNRVPKETIRLYRIRSRLDQARRKP